MTTEIKVSVLTLAEISTLVARVAELQKRHADAVEYAEDLHEELRKARTDACSVLNPKGIRLVGDDVFIPVEPAE